MRLGGNLSAEIIDLRDKLQEARSERDQLASRNAELEHALAPFAEILLNQCDSTAFLTDKDTIPVPMGVVRQAARAHAGTS